MVLVVERSAETGPKEAVRREPGDQIAGRFRIEERLAEGGMGVVFRVLDERSGQRLALKQLRDHGGQNPGFVGVQFEREFHTLSQLSHPCIIQVFDYGIDEGGAYYTMELLQGEDLRQRGKLPWREACAVLRDVASSLAILHSRRLLHRDVTARNVYCTVGGRSKLIDFGGMMPMGLPKHVVGTPPFVPPEALQQQALDGRADLYSLGALAYWTMTGSHAYPARSFAELKQHFDSPPPALRQYEPEVPEALEQLVMGLLQLDRSARPATAAEVMERLSVIAGLPLEERSDVGKAYLVTPTLVGRSDVLERVRVAMLGARRDEGANVLIEGEVGSGCSRVLDACVLLAKLRGAAVLRADATDAAAGPYGVARALASQLLEALPSEAQRAARSHGDLLRHVVPELAAQGSAAPREAPERRHLQAALRDWFLVVARAKHIVIAVDDIERADEPSAALLGSLAHGARRRRLNLILTQRIGAAPTAALELLRSEAVVAPLAPLSAGQTESLLRAVFGDVPHVSALAERVHALSGGSPGSTMTLAEHLVSRGIARYEAGGWALPAELRADQLPSSMTEALQARVALLPADARDLAEVLALTDPPLLPPELYPALSEHADHGRTYRALEALIASGVLTLLGDRYCFVQNDMPGALERPLSPERRRALHERLARVLQNSPLRARVPHHLLLGGQERAAIERLLEHDGPSYASFGRQDLDVLLPAVEAADRLGLALRTRLELRVLLVGAAAATGQRSLFLAHAELLKRRFERDSGLADFAKLPAEMEATARLVEALRRADERYRAAPAFERGFTTDELDSRMAHLYSAFCTMAAITQELQLLENLPRLDPLVPRWPALGPMQRLVDVSRDLQAGRTSMALEQAQALVAAAEDPEALGVEPRYASALRLSQLYVLGLFAATGGQARARELVAELEQVPGHRVNAWRVRMVYELMHGDMEAAADCQRRSELLNLQDGGQLQFPGTTARVELLAYMYADDLIGVKRAAERIGQLAEHYPGWLPTLAVARCHYRRLQGDAAGGLTELEAALQVAQPGRHLDWWLVAYSHVRVLNDLERRAEAVELGQRYLEIWTALQLSTVDYGLRQVTAEALMRVGRTEDARRMIDEYIDMHQRAGTRGLRLGLAYETRARVAIAMRDGQAVQEYTRLCAEEYRGGRHLTVLNRYARLVREADAGGIVLTSGLDLDATSHISAAQTHVAQTVQSRLMSCVGESERVAGALQVLLEAGGADAGFLYGLSGGSLRQIAQSPGEADAPSGVLEWLETCLRRELQGEVSTQIDAGMQEPETTERFTDPAGREFQAVPLSGKREGRPVVAGFAAIHYPAGRRPALRRTVVGAVTEVLIADGIVEPIDQ